MKLMTRTGFVPVLICVRFDDFYYMIVFYRCQDAVLLALFFLLSATSQYPGITQRSSSMMIPTKTPSGSS